jgi:hypothetical protein
MPNIFGRTRGKPAPITIIRQILRHGIVAPS